MAPTVVFDVNETLLDLSALDDTFGRIFGDASLRPRWFALVLRNALTLTVTGDYADFVTVGRASLQMVAAADERPLQPGDLDALSAAMTRLPPHSDVEPSLQRLQAAGATIAALTNSPPAAATAQLANAGVLPYFRRVMSVDSVRRFKPAAATYQHAADELSVAIEDLVMVAAHDWDVAGAMRAGAQGAFVKRAGMAWNPLYPEPDIVATELVEVVTQILEESRNR